MKKRKSTNTSLSKTAFNKDGRQLKESIVGEKASASFVCGDTIPVKVTEAVKPAIPVTGAKRAKAITNAAKKPSNPVNISWAAKDDSQARKLVLPLGSSTALHNSNDA